MNSKKKNHDWERVVATPPKDSEILKRAQHKSARESGVFVEACRQSGIPVTQRQVSKWCNGKGLARGNRTRV